MSSREQFEAWIAGTTNSDLHRGIMLDRHENGRYRHLATENKWEAWQEATKQSEAKCAALAAENAALNEKMNKLATWPGIEFYSSAWEFNNGDGNAAIEFMCDVQTPATDAFLAEVRAQGVKSLSNAVQSVISERQRQQSVEGWTPEHDDEHTEGEMAEAAACYAMFANNQGFSVPGLWPWAREWWKQSGQRRDLVKAGALILAEIERIDRQESAQ
ncbi:hypothetical protein [Enterobacter roggenkampii]|uniref:hypothetical protein n=1 Tax=Enterobacter roggenkampii TaxID=1812935 RepID=UPI002019FF6F|nr:hypothetical protein [Enterobacter roggenkampii]UQQ53039.1 hypothetical protein MUY33_10590 [Enterobacter roggenkampii]